MLVFLSAFICNLRYMVAWVRKFSFAFVVLIVLPCLSLGQIITTIAGTGSSSFSGDNGPATAAGVPNPAQGDFDKYGNYYYAEASSNRIRKINTLGIITTVAGNGMGGFAGDNTPATAARIYGPVDVKLDAAQNLYIADVQNNRIRKVDAATGIITTIVGTGTPGYSGEGTPATAALLWGPEAVCIDKFGNLYIADVVSYRIRKVTPAGIISTFAGNGIAGYSGEGTRADTSMVGMVVGLCSDTAGNIFFANNSVSPRVFKINTSGMMNTVAGNGVTTYSVDGVPATTANIAPVAVAVDSFNNLFIADKYNNRAYKVDAVSGILYNVAGNGVAGDSGDGSAATTASLFKPIGVTLDPCGNLYIPTIGDGVTVGAGRRIRKVTFNPPCTVPTPTIANNLTKPIPEFSISPTPAYNELTLTANTPITNITITNLIGKTVYTQSCQSEKAEVDISGLPAGVYLLRVTDGEGHKMVRRFLKE